MKNAEQFCISLIKTCKTLKSLQQFHSHAITTNLITNPLITGKLILHCCINLSNTLTYAQKILLNTPHPDTFMFNTLIRGFSDSDTPHHSISTFNSMLKHVVGVDSFSFAFAVKGAANMRCLRTGVQLHCQAVLRGLEMHLFVGTTLISMYAECGGIEFAKKVFDEMPERNVVTWNAIVTGFFRCEDVEGAESVFGLMPVKNVSSYNLMLAGYTRMGEIELARRMFGEMVVKDDVSWSTMIVGFTQHGYFDEAFECFKELLSVGMTPNEVSLTGVLSACAQAGTLEFAKILHGFVEKVGLVWITTVNNALTDTYAKCGSLDMAHLVFERMPGERSIITWTSIISGLAMQGNGEEALNRFQEMKDSGIKPDGIVFVAVLYACSHAGLVVEGCELFNNMNKVYGIKPEIEHYGCMVDLYGRAGQLSKAYDFITSMPFPPNAVIWRTLLGSCSFYGNLVLAKQVQEQLLKLDPNHSGDHVLLSNIYAGLGKWKDVVKVRQSMAEMNVIKTPGWSMIEVDKVMHRFIAGGQRDDVTMEAYEKLKEIMLKLRVEGGYVPDVVNVLHDIEEEEKGDSIVTHSEKLAVAFGMVRLSKGSVIRVVKNLRVCKDCHVVMKLISKVYELEIVLRDRSRFHSFKGGICSCKEYW